jgi:hypothetical protein
VTRALEIVLETEPIERADAEVAVATFFQSDRPLRGAASRADWRLCGMLSALLAGGRLTGAAGDALLVPTFGHLRAPRLLLLGLGTPERFGASEVAAAVRDAVVRVLDLRVRTAALGIPGDWLGAVPARPAAEAVTRGALDAVALRGGAAAIRLLVPEAGASRALRGLEAAAARAQAEGIRLRLPDLEPEVGAAVRPARTTPRSPDPISPSPGRP